MAKAMGFESAFCTSWEEWAQYDTASFGFMGATLTPEYEALLRITKVDRLDIDLDNMEAYFIRHNGEHEEDDVILASAKLELVATSVKVENK